MPRKPFLLRQAKGTEAQSRLPLAPPRPIGVRPALPGDLHAPDGAALRLSHLPDVLRALRPTLGLPLRPDHDARVHLHNDRVGCRALPQHQGA